MDVCVYRYVCMCEILGICFHHQTASRILQGSGMQEWCASLFHREQLCDIEMPLVEQASARSSQAELPWTQGVQLPLVCVCVIEAVKVDGSCLSAWYI